MIYLSFLSVNMDWGRKKADHIRLQVSDPKVVMSSSHVFEKE